MFLMKLKAFEALCPCASNAPENNKTGQELEELSLKIRRVGIKFLKAV